MYELTRIVKGKHRFVEINEKRFKFLSFARDLIERILENVLHVIESDGQIADLIVGAVFDLAFKFTARDLFRALGESADGRGDGFRQEKRKQNGDRKPDKERLQSDLKDHDRKGTRLVLLILDVNDAVVRAVLEIYGVIDIIRPELLFRTVHARHRGNEIGGLIERRAESGI